MGDEDTDRSGECSGGGDHDVPSDGSSRVCANCGAEFLDDEDD